MELGVEESSFFASSFNTKPTKIAQPNAVSINRILPLTKSKASKMLLPKMVKSFQRLSPRIDGTLPNKKIPIKVTKIALPRRILSFSCNAVMMTS